MAENQHSTKPSEPEENKRGHRRNYCRRGGGLSVLIVPRVFVLPLHILRVFTHEEGMATTQGQESGSLGVIRLEPTGIKLGATGDETFDQRVQMFPPSLALQFWPLPERFTSHWCHQERARSFLSLYFGVGANVLVEKLSTYAFRIRCSLHEV